MIRSFLFALLSLGVSICTFAQPSTAENWSVKPPFKADFMVNSSEDGAHIVASSRSQVAVIDGATGKVRWQVDLPSITGNKKSDIQYLMDEAGVFLVYDKKAGVDVMYAFDLQSGELLWSNNRFQKVSLSSLIYFPDQKGFIVISEVGMHMIDAKSGQERWSVSTFTGGLAEYFYDGDKQELIALNYKVGWGALLGGFKNQLISVQVDQGTVNWDIAYQGVVHVQPFTYQPHLFMEVDEDNIYLVVESLQVIDRNKGTIRFTEPFAHFDQRLTAFVYGAIADPVVHGDHLYLVYNKRGRKEVNIRKVHKLTGTLAWERRLEGKNPVIPHVYVVGDQLILQEGGTINLQGTADGKTFSRMKTEGPFSIQSFATDDGSPVWHTEELKEPVSPLLLAGGRLYLSDKKGLHAFDPSNGDVVHTLPAKQTKLGELQGMFAAGGKLFQVGENGFFCVDAATGQLVGQEKVSKVFNARYDADYNKGLVFGDKQLHVLAPESGKTVLTYKYVKGAKWKITTAGFYVLGEKTIAQYKL